MPLLGLIGSDRVVAETADFITDWSESRFIGENGQEDSDSDADAEGIEDEEYIADSTNEPDIKDFDSKCSLKEEEDNTPKHEDRQIEHEVVEEDRHIQREDNPEEESSQAGCEHDSEAEQIENPELFKRLSKQRQRAIQAARGKKKSSTSRTIYTDKGGRSSYKSKIQKQMSSW
ncbi:unnamed protein product [Fraxinus pennsylvanica]|uniref:Uncharacterized protein n=1 Tax=Fraxinus pennsylvanica TaxID=56036 RepID=A0AAD2DI51_9LAMI|nr:unnamed protein product [Fraxinus pennsylvanica]